jgi:hypothetical protein
MPILRGCTRCNSGRLSLVTMLNALELRGMAVEVGSHRGEFAAPFLQRWKGSHLYCIDPWYNPPGYEEQATYLHISRGENRHLDYEACAYALHAVDPELERHTLIRSLSLDAVRLFPHGYFDFVYIDADHTRPAIDNDLEAWWHKVTSGGLLAGHDFICPMEIDGGWGRFIQPAVMEFAARYNVDVWLVGEPTSPDPKEPNLFPLSYYMLKP